MGFINKIMILLMFSIGFIYASENPKAETQKQTQSALDMFLFKIGFTSLQEEFSNEQKNINLNTQEITKLKADISFLLQESIKNKLSNTQENDSNTDTKITIIELQEENKKLKEYIKKLESGYKMIEPEINEDQNSSVDTMDINHLEIKQKSNLIQVVVGVKTAVLRHYAFEESEVVGNVYKDDILLIESCDIHDWCKIYNKTEFIPKYKLKVLEGEF